MGGHATQRDSSLTLIEVCIVLAVLGILLGLVAMSFGDLRTNPQRRAMLAERDSVQLAIDTYNQQDLNMDAAPIIPARNGPAPITPADGDVPFKKYLPRETQYLYTWGFNGKGLTVVR
jgi:hypothetical protein